MNALIRCMALAALAVASGLPSGAAAQSERLAGIAYKGGTAGNQYGMGIRQYGHSAGAKEFQMIRGLGGKCIDVAVSKLDAATGKPGYGSAIHLWDCKGGDNQLWYVGAGGIESKLAPGMCIVGNHNRRPQPSSSFYERDQGALYLSSCGPVTWLWARNSGTLRMAKAEGFCIDVQGKSDKNGTPLLSYRCNDEKNQRWEVAVPSPQRQLARLDSPQWLAFRGIAGKCLDVDAKSRALKLWDCNGSPSQAWTFSSLGIENKAYPETCPLAPPVLPAIAQAQNLPGSDRRIRLGGCSISLSQHVWIASEEQGWPSLRVATKDKKDVVKSPYKDGICMDAHEQKSANDTMVVWYPCTLRQANQTWKPEAQKR